MVHHRVDSILEFENLALHIDRDLLGKVAVGYGRGHFGDISHLASQIAGHRIYAVRQILPGARNSLDLRLATEFSFGADFASHAGHL